VINLHIRFCSGFAASTTMATVSGIANFSGKRSTRKTGIDSTAIRTTTGTSRVYVVSSAGTVEERIVTIGQTAGELVEITSGVARGETVATSNVAQLGDGVRITGHK